MKLAIIHSGLSGLTAAALLGQADHEVPVYEQYHEIGGVTANTHMIHRDLAPSPGLVGPL